MRKKFRDGCVVKIFLLIVMIGMNIKKLICSPINYQLLHIKIYLIWQISAVDLSSLNIEEEDLL